MSIPNSTWPGIIGNLPNSPWPGIIKLFPLTESWVSYIPAGDGNVANLFLRCTIGYEKRGFYDELFVKTDLAK
jgi:hypothetical protein